MLQSYRKYIHIYVYIYKYMYIYTYIVTGKQQKSLQQNALAQLFLSHSIQLLKNYPR